MSCDVCLAPFEGSAEFFYQDWRKARKVHKCHECNGAIQPGERYCRVGGKCEGSIWRQNICRFCEEIQEVFSCDGGVEYGNLWEQMDDYILPELKVTSPCFQKLSLETRQFLTNKWWNWKERNAG
jgi:hypothetical protein